MDRDSSEKWFHMHFLPEVQAFLKDTGLPQKAVMLLDNAPSHSRESVMTSNNGLITVKSLPPPPQQPTDQGLTVFME
jgi:hypothetical protein